MPCLEWWGLYGRGRGKETKKVALDSQKGGRHNCTTQSISGNNVIIIPKPPEAWNIVGHFSTTERNSMLLHFSTDASPFQDYLAPRMRNRLKGKIFLMLKVISNWIGLVLACVISTYSTLIVVKGNLLVKSSTKDAVRKPPFMTSIN